jgi:hypothetical protein
MGLSLLFWRIQMAKQKNKSELPAPVTQVPSPAPKAKKPEPAAVTEISKDPLPLTLSRFGLAEERRNIWKARPKHGTEPEDLLVPAYWQHVGELMNVTDEITAMAEDGSWYCKYLVLSAGRLYAHVAMLEPGPTQLDPDVERSTDSAALAGYRFEYAGETEKWRALLDGNVLKSGFRNESSVRAWGREHALILQQGQKKIAAKRATL